MISVKELQEGQIVRPIFESNGEPVYTTRLFTVEKIEDGKAYLEYFPAGHPLKKHYCEFDNCEYTFRVVDDKVEISPETRETLEDALAVAYYDRTLDGSIYWEDLKQYDLNDCYDFFKGTEEGKEIVDLFIIEANEFLNSDYTPHWNSLESVASKFADDISSSKIPVLIDLNKFASERKEEELSR